MSNKDFLDEFIKGMEDIKKQGITDDVIFKESFPEIQKILATAIGKVSETGKLNTFVLTHSAIMYTMAILEIINAAQGDSEYRVALKLIKEFVNKEIEAATKRFRGDTSNVNKS